jgi:DUF4097 and DUF4098 domain-containing protein YvlB
MASPSNMTTNPPQPVYPHRRRSLAGPLVLITIGVLFLLANTSVITWGRLDMWFTRYWPVFIILWGVIKLVEYMNARRQGQPAPGIGVGGALLVFFIIVLGLGFNGVHHVRNNWGPIFNDGNDWNWSFNNTYDFSDQAQQAVKPGTTLEISSNYGDITVNSWEQDQIKVVDRKHVAANGDSDAKALSDATKPVITVSGDRVTVEVSTNSGSSGSQGRVTNNLEIYLPRNMALDITTRRGNIVVRGRTGLVKANTSRGDVTVQDVQGDATLTTRGGDARVDGVTGDVHVDAAGFHMGETQVANVKGEAHINADVIGSLRFSHIGKLLQFTSSRTDLRVTRLDGDLTIDGSDLHATALAGPVQLSTRAKNIRFDNVSDGDINVQTTNGDVTINVTSAKQPLGNIDVTDRHGNVQVSLPARSNFFLQATATHGDVYSEFAGINQMNQSRVSTATGTIGSGGPRVQVTTDGGSVRIRKGI